jgi:hypothetical protein
VKLFKSRVPNWALSKTRTSLEAWRERTAAELFQNSILQPEDAQEALLPEALLAALSRDGYHIKTIGDLQGTMENKWTWFDRFGNEVLEVIKKAGDTGGVDIRARGVARAAAISRAKRNKNAESNSSVQSESKEGSRD